MQHGQTAGPVVVGLGGSTGENSVTTLLLRAALAIAAAQGARTAVLAGDQLAGLPIYSASRDAAVPPAARELVESVRNADAVIVATPGYHGGMSGLVKNALDHLEALRSDRRPYLDGRAVGIIVAAAGWQAGGTALVSVRSAVHALRGWPTPFGVTINSAQSPVDAEGSLHGHISSALGVLVGQLMDFASWRAAADAARVVATSRS